MKLILSFEKSIVKNLLICIFFFVLVLAQIHSASAWLILTHKEIVNCNYNSFPPDIQKNIDIKKMEKGSIAPDIDFMDFKYHQYPESYLKVQKWLHRGHDAYYQGNYTYASYCFGVASHYITDTFTAPHAANINVTCWSPKSIYQHLNYEINALSLKPHLQNDQYPPDIHSTLYNGHINGQIIWKCWDQTNDISIIQLNLDKATTASYCLIIYSLNTTKNVYSPF